ncbi:MAG: hypothetical protein A3F92_13255 [Candidatus Rokubacteria bacterium RIFCSPLOWO2_12_FULL_71_22]|nr:MAG: hypothetical protein A3F92_13255 [Candidatus Rokubacteria bacterium RIFCSPLOWO2_12_FULL_71_22]
MRPNWSPSFRAAVGEIIMPARSANVSSREASGALSFNRTVSASGVSIAAIFDSSDATAAVFLS